MKTHTSIPGKKPGTIIKHRQHDSTYQPPKIRNQKQRNCHCTKSKYVDSIISLDIETSTVDEIAFIWKWQICIDGEIIHGRSLEDLNRWIDEFIKIQELSDERRAIFFVHNLSYEFQFIKKTRSFTDIFAVNPHSELSALSDGCIEWRCSYLLTDMSLKKWCETSKEIPFFKQEMNYKEVRTPSSDIPDNDMSYCSADVLAMYFGLRERLKDDNFYTLPKTATGYVRRDFRKACKNNKEWQNYYRRLRLTPEAYLMYSEAFQGGQVRIAPHWVEKIIPIFSDDITSSYPYRMLVNEFPTSTPKIIEKPDFSEFMEIVNGEYLAIFDLTLTNVMVKHWKLEYIQGHVPKGKKKKIKIAYDNGRVVSADLLRLTVTSIDFFIIKECYDFEIANINKILYHSRKDLIPRCFRNVILEYAKIKTELKGVEGREFEYEQTKRRFNASYGMTVTRPIRDIVKYDENLSPYIERVRLAEDNLPNIEKELNKFYRSRNNFLPYEIGVWVTAYARFEWFKMVDKMGTDFVYGDTDSVKHYLSHDRDFEERNAEIEREALAIYSIDEIAPKDIKGKRHFLGKWDRENDSPVLFLGYGSKKYFCRFADGTEKITVAGCSKRGKEWYHVHGKSVLHAKLGDEISPEYSQRTSALYIDEEREIVINGEYITVPSCMIIKDVPYTLNITEEHKLYALQQRNEYVKEVLKHE